LAQGARKVLILLALVRLVRGLVRRHFRFSTWR
jgi:hypothetical protein